MNAFISPTEPPRLRFLRSKVALGGLRLAAALALIIFSGCMVLDPYQGQTHLTDVAQLALPTAPQLKISAGAPAGRIVYFASDRDGRVLATYGTDKSIMLWNTDSGTLLHEVRQPEFSESDLGVWRPVALSPDGAFLAFAADAVQYRSDYAVILYDVRAGRMLARLGPFPQTVSSLAFSRSGSALAVTYSDNRQMVGGLKVFTVADGAQIFETSYPGEFVPSVTWTADDEILVNSFNHIRAYQYARGGIPTLAREVAADACSFAGTSPDGRTTIRIRPDVTGHFTVSFLDAATLRAKNSVTVSSGLVLQAPCMDSSGNAAGVMGDASGDSFGILVDGRGGTRVLVGSEEHPSFASSIGSDRLGISCDRGVVVFKNGQQVGLFGGPAGLGLFKEHAHQELTVSPSLDRLRLQRFRMGSAEFSLGDRTLKDVKGTDANFAALRPDDVKLLTGWEWAANPVRWGRRLPDLLRFEFPMSVVSDPNGQWIAVGTTASRLLVYDAPGRLRWEKPVPMAMHLRASADGQRMLAALSDGTVRWYRMTDGQEICALFVHADKKRWVLWTPEGFFDCAPGAESLIGYRVNRGPDREADFVSISQMYDTFYRPDLVSKKIQNEDMAEVAEAVAQTGDAGSVVAQGMPPRVEIIDPAGGPVSDAVTARARITDGGSGIGRVVWRVNGVNVDTGRGMSVQAASSPREVEAALHLLPGDNEIEVTAFNERNLIESAPARVKVTVAATASDDTQPSLYVVAVGINKYRDRDLTLQYSVPDATALATLFKQCGQGVYAGVNVLEINDEQATKDGIRKMLTETAGRVRSEDVFVLYLAGHGLALDGSYYFIPSDLVYQNEDSVRQNAVSQKDLQEMLASIPALRSVVLLDTCNSGAFATPGMRGLATKTAMDKLSRATGRATISASTEAQAAMEGYEGHGVFTYALLQGMKGEADGQGNGDHQITINELADYVGRKVPELTKAKWGYEQFPMQNLQGRPFVIGAAVP